MSERTASGEGGVPSGRRWERVRRIATLDVRQDYLEITQLFYADFKSVMIALPFAGFLTTFAAPRMSRILASTGELGQRFDKRAVDTSLFAVTVIHHGFGSGPGREAARRVNELHRQYDIHPDDFVLVGCDPPLFSLDMADRFGWRAVTAKERAAVRRFYDHQARAFGSRDRLPADEAGMRALVDRYFDTQLHFEPQNRTLAARAIDWYVGKAPRATRPLVRRIFLALLDPRVVRACGLTVPSRASRALAWAVMKARGRMDPVPAAAMADPLGDIARSVYPDGYTIADLGPRCPVAHGAG